MLPPRRQHKGQLMEIRHRTGEGGPTDKVLLPIFRARSQSVQDKEIQMPKVKLSNTDGTVVCVTASIHTCLTLLRCWKTQTTLEQKKS